MSATEESHAETETSSYAPANNRLLITHEGLLDPSMLVRTEGYMYKKGGAVNSRGGLRNWKKRWFVIETVDFFGTQGFELQYFSAPNGKLKGKVGLSDVELFVETKSTNKKVKYEFQILLQNGGVLELSCDTAEEREEWIDTLNMIIAYMHKILTSSAMTLDGYDPLYEDDAETYRLGEEIASNCQAFGPGLFGSEAGQMAQFVVQIHDLTGNQVTKGGMPITATISNADCLYYLRIQDNDDGSYLAQYTLGSHGSYDLSIKINDEHHIFGSPFHIEILPSRTIPKFCVASGQALQQIRVREIETFTITAKDGFGNSKTRGGDPFEVGVMGPAQLRSLTDNGDGTYTCEIEASNPAGVSYVAASSLMILVTLQGKHILGSPFKPTILDDPYSGGRGGALSPLGGAAAAPYARSITAEEAALMSSNNSAQSSRRGYGIGGGLDAAVGAGGSVALSASGASTPVKGGAAGSVASSSPFSMSHLSTSQSGGPPRSPAVPAAATNSQFNTSLNASRQQQQQQALSQSAGGAAGGGALSRLEKARQRALLAKGAAGDAVPMNSTQQRGSVMPSTSTAPAAAPAGSYNPQQQQQQWSAASQATIPAPSAPPARFNASASAGGGLNATAPVGAGGSRLSQLAARSQANLNVMKKTAAGIPLNEQEYASGNIVPRVVDLPAVLASLRAGLGNSHAPVNTSADEQRVWDAVHRSFLNQDVINMLINHTDVLKGLFDLFSDCLEGVHIIKMTTSSAGTGGVYRLLEHYDVIPALVTKIEVKTLFSLVAHSQVLHFFDGCIATELISFNNREI